MRYTWDFGLAHTEVVQISTNARGILFFPCYKERVENKEFLAHIPLIAWKLEQNPDYLYQARFKGTIL